MRLQRVSEVRSRALAVEKAPERGLHASLERAREWSIGDRVCASVEEQLDDLSIPGLDHMLKGDRIDLAPYFRAKCMTDGCVRQHDSFSTASF
jgi:hypothetical protein